mgnify:CR=1 FL=1
MKKLDFIEIGTSDFQTLTQSCSPNEMGIAIEPIKYYLDRLPNKPNVIKINAAIVGDENLKEVDVYYVSDENQAKHNLGNWLRGCNRVGEPHDLHLQYCHPSIFHSYPAHSIIPAEHSPRNLVKEGLVDIIKAPCYTFRYLVETYGFDYVEFIKTDTEGMDSIIINNILDYYEISKMELPKKIVFESNAHTRKQDTDNLADRLRKLGYNVNVTYTDDTTAIR